MKRIFLQCVLLAALLLTATTATAQNKQKRQIRLEYTLNNLRITAEQKTKLRPIVKAYLDELHDATDAYDDRKDELKDAIRAHRLTDREADGLLTLKLNADAREANLKRKYTAKFKAVIGAKQTWYCFDLLNDKMSKITGEKK